MPEQVLRAAPESVRTGMIDRNYEPVLMVESGDVVNIETWSAWGNAVTQDTTIDDVLNFFAASEGAGPHDLTGPVGVRGSQPGDVLRVDVQEIRLRPHAFNIDLPGHFGIGMLPEEFAEGHMRHFELDLRSMTVEFAPGITIPLEPFAGYMGVAPAAPGPHSSIPPGAHGGNLDIKMLGVGSTLYLPVSVEDARFYVGDVHAAQGDGEVNLTALEASAESVQVRLSVLRPSTPLQSPRAETRSSFVTMAFAETVDAAAQSATVDMIRFLTGVTGLSREECYALCSIAMDLTISQVVNGRVGVHACIPKSIFAQGIGSAVADLSVLR